MFCEACEKEGQKSMVTATGASRTLIGFTVFWDEEGKYHEHDPNITTGQYRCTRGHVWTIKMGPKTCPQGDYPRATT